jgi:hypothetical protein
VYNKNMKHIDKIKEIIENNKKSGVTPMSMLNPENYTDSQTADNRFSICQQCPEFISATTQCKKCGCIMKAKTKLTKAFCPIGKW